MHIQEFIDIHGVKTFRIVCRFNDIMYQNQVAMINLKYFKSMRAYQSEVQRVKEKLLLELDGVLLPVMVAYFKKDIDKYNHYCERIDKEMVKAIQEKDYFIFQERANELTYLAKFGKVAFKNT